MSAIARNKWVAGIASTPLYIFIALMMSSFPAAVWVVAILGAGLLVDFVYSKILSNFTEDNRSHIVFIGIWLIIQLLIITAWWLGVGLFNETT
ncbi:hypothetical protein DV711_11025 [Motiliproteus coralliicola]|uniref:Uncharacterized protein n=1 Tax=Motiliproteus coralliicola TaxID=2283196 RepID=A0A369WDN0_9GAMM|nr:hypothetical protein [Motiliproteus coralliicola]RDE19421.1 hypothetical protein DV711_11025 [Motiliproteus coralliicola]